MLKLECITYCFNNYCFYFAVNTITQLSTVSLQCMISSNNTLEVYVHWKFYVSSTMISMGVMMLDCGNIQVNENTDIYYSCS